MASAIQRPAALWRCLNKIRASAPVRPPRAPRSAGTGSASSRPGAALLLGIGLGIAAGACVPEGPESTVVGPGNNSLTLAWDAPSRDASGGPLDDLVGYRLYYSDSSPITPTAATPIDVGDRNRFTVEGLEPGIYYFAVSALDASGNESALSEELRVEVGEP